MLAEPAKKAMAGPSTFLCLHLPVPVEVPLKLRATRHATPSEGWANDCSLRVCYRHGSGEQILSVTNAG